jgi:hypothetical protein
LNNFSAEKVLNDTERGKLMTPPIITSDTFKNENYGRQAQDLILYHCTTPERYEHMISQGNFLELFSTGEELSSTDTMTWTSTDPKWVWSMSCAYRLEIVVPNTVSNFVGLIATDRHGTDKHTTVVLPPFKFKRMLSTEPYVVRGLSDLPANYPIEVKNDYYTSNENFQFHRSDIRVEKIELVETVENEVSNKWMDKAKEDGGLAQLQNYDCQKICPLKSSDTIDLKCKMYVETLTQLLMDVKTLTHKVTDDDEYEKEEMALKREWSRLRNDSVIIMRDCSEAADLMLNDSFSILEDDYS